MDFEACSHSSYIVGCPSCQEREKQKKARSESEPLVGIGPVLAYDERPSRLIRHRCRYGKNNQDEEWCSKNAMVNSPYCLKHDTAMRQLIRDSKGVQRKKKRRRR
jgi:hypothetical protein